MYISQTFFASKYCKKQGKRDYYQRSKCATLPFVMPLWHKTYALAWCNTKANPLSSSLCITAPKASFAIANPYVTSSNTVSIFALDESG